MTPNEIARVQDYLRRLFANERIAIDLPARRGAPVEVRVGDEFVGVLHRDEEDGELSYQIQMTVLAEDLPPLAEVRPAPADARRR